MRIVGIDPGLNGALAFISVYEDGRHEVGVVMDAPRIDAGKGMLDANSLAQSLKGQGGQTLVVIERQQAMPFAFKGKDGKERKQGSTSTFSTGYGFGLYMGILAALEIRHAVVSAQTWQKEMYQGAVGEGKERSMYVAGQLFPGIHMPKSKHGRADALLIAEYGRRRLA